MPVPTPTSAPSNSRLLTFTSHRSFRHRLILSLLSHRPIKITQIRPHDTEPGLKPYEISFLRLVEKLTSNSKVEISLTGTSILFQPGALSPPPYQVTHVCPNERSVGWFLEPILAIAPFGRLEINLLLKGVTTDAWGPSADILRTSYLPHLALFLPPGEAHNGLELRIAKRGHPPQGGGEVHFRCPVVRAVKTGFGFLERGRVRKVRGIAHTVRASPQFSNRMVSAARSVLNRYIPDIYIYTDVYRGDEGGKSPGYALSLLSTSTTTVLHSSEASSSTFAFVPSSNPNPHPSTNNNNNTNPNNNTNNQQMTPEDVGVLAARQLLSEIKRGGCLDRGTEWLAATMLVLGGERDVGKVMVGGPFEASFIQFLRDIKQFFGITFKIKPVPRETWNQDSDADSDLDDEDDLGGALGDFEDLEQEEEEEEGSGLGSGRKELRTPRIRESPSKDDDSEDEDLDQSASNSNSQEEDEEMGEDGDMSESDDSSSSGASSIKSSVQRTKEKSRLEPPEEYILSCVGVGYANVAKKAH